jgi:L-glyceraldehyde 3-phosphate reductase
VRALNEFAAARHQTLAQLALNWILRQPSVTTVLFGASSVAQLEQNVDALAAPALTHDEIAAIEPHAVHGTSLA